MGWFEGWGGVWREDGWMDFSVIELDLLSFFSFELMEWFRVEEIWNFEFGNDDCFVFSRALEGGK